jgi:hypothetical protein
MRHPPAWDRCPHRQGLAPRCGARASTAANRPAPARSERRSPARPPAGQPTQPARGRARGAARRASRSHAHAHGRAGRVRVAGVPVPPPALQTPCKRPVSRKRSVCVALGEGGAWMDAVSSSVRYFGKASVLEAAGGVCAEKPLEAALAALAPDRAVGLLERGEQVSSVLRGLRSRRGGPGACAARDPGSGSTLGT